MWTIDRLQQQEFETKVLIRTCCSLDSVPPPRDGESDINQVAAVLGDGFGSHASASGTKCGAGTWEEAQRGLGAHHASVGVDPCPFRQLSSLQEEKPPSL